MWACRSRHFTCLLSLAIASIFGSCTAIELHTIVISGVLVSMTFSLSLINSVSIFLFFALSLFALACVVVVVSINLIKRTIEWNEQHVFYATREREREKIWRKMSVCVCLLRLRWHVNDFVEPIKCFDAKIAQSYEQAKTNASIFYYPNKWKVKLPINCNVWPIAQQRSSNSTFE